MKKIALILTCAVLCVGCTSQNNYDAIQNDFDELDEEYEALEDEMKVQEDLIEELEDKLEVSASNYDSLNTLYELHAQTITSQNEVLLNFEEEIKKLEAELENGSANGTDRLSNLIHIVDGFYNYEVTNKYVYIKDVEYGMFNLGRTNIETGVFETLLDNQYGEVNDTIRIVDIMVSKNDEFVLVVTEDREDGLVKLTLYDEAMEGQFQVGLADVVNHMNEPVDYLLNESFRLIAFSENYELVRCIIGNDMAADLNFSINLDDYSIVVQEYNQEGQWEEEEMLYPSDNSK